MAWLRTLHRFGFAAILVDVPFIERVASREIYRNAWLVLREDDIRRPDGSTGIYAVVDKPTYALVMPYDGHRFRLARVFDAAMLIRGMTKLPAYLRVWSGHRRLVMFGGRSVQDSVQGGSTEVDSVSESVQR